MTSIATPYATSPSTRPGVLTFLENDSFRRLLYVALMLCLALLGWGARTFQARQVGEPVDFIVSDAMGYYMYLPSILLDGDLNFRNQVDFHLKTSHPPVEADFIGEDGSSRNRYPTGLALTLLPPFGLAHGVSKAIYAATGNDTFAPNGYTIVYQFLCVTWVMGLATIALMLADELMRRRGASGWATTAGIFTYVLGSNFAYYVFREPLMSHLAGASWIITAVWAAEGVLQNRRAHWGLWLLASFAGCIAITCRMTNVFMAPVVIWFVWRLWKQGRLMELGRSLPFIVVGMLPVIVQFLVWHRLTGKAVINGAQGAGYYDYEVFYWTQPALWQTLISSRHGLFFWSPILLFSAWGIFWHLRRTMDGLVIAWIVGAMVVWYLNSAWWGWAFGQSFGHRAFLELAGLFLIGTVMAFESLASAKGTRRRASLGFVGICVAYSWVMMALFITHRIPRDAWLWGTEAERTNMAPYPKRG